MKKVSATPCSPHPVYDVVVLARAMIYNLCGSPVVATFALPISLGFPIFFSSQTLRGTPLRGSIGRSWPAFYALGRGSRSRQSPGVFAKVSQPEGGKSDDGGVGKDEKGGGRSGWTAGFAGFRSMRVREGGDDRKEGGDDRKEGGDDRKEGGEADGVKGPFDSDDVDVLESFAEREAQLRGQTVEGARLDAVMEDDWPRLTAEALSGAWREWRRFVLTRLGIYALWLSGFLFASTGMSYYLGRHFVNQALPWMSATVSQAANRPIRIGRCKGLWPAGLLGAGSFLDVGPLVIGPAEAERSIVEVANVKLSLRPIASLLQFKIVVAAHLEGVQATMRQGENGSWLGYPEDTLPVSARPTITIPKRGGPGDAADGEGGGVKLALDSIRVVNGTASLHLAGDPDPRLLKRVNGTISMSRRGRLDLDIQANPVSRSVPPQERPVTMRSETAPRHLRAEQTAAEKKSLVREIARGNDGGHIRCFLSLAPANNTGAGNGKGKAGTLAADNGLADLKVRVQLNNTSAAVVERTIPGLPIDVSAGRVDGELRLRSHSRESWKFPEFGGQIRCRGVNLHFWDSTDSFADTDVDLVFEGTRMYLHGGKGFYGAVPITASGDMDLAPGEKNVKQLKEMRDSGELRPKNMQPGSGRSGEYRISAQVSGVDAHALRETLGVKPPPRPLAGAVRGFLYVGGPLEYPIFTGSAETIPPKPEDIRRGVPGTEVALSEDAVRAGASEGAIAAYDAFAVKDARAVFTVDTWGQKVTLHEAEVSPVAGGEARASGTIMIDQGALSNPEAVDIELEAEGFDPKSVVASLTLKGAASTRATPVQSQTFPATNIPGAATDVDASGGWLPGGIQQLFSPNGPGATGDKVMDEDTYWAAATAAAKDASAKLPMGLPPQIYDKIVPSAPGSATATVKGPLSAPVVDAKWAVKDATMSGDLNITRNRISTQVRAPAIEFSGSADTSYPPLEVALAARTVEDALAAGRPAFTRAEGDATFRSLDLAALVVAEDDLARLAPPDRLRLRLSGRVNVKGDVDGAGAAAEASLPRATPASVKAARQALAQLATHGIDTTPSVPYTPSVDGEYEPQFSGKVSLEGLRVNQLSLAPRLSGEVEASKEGASINARGRADELLRVEMDIPNVDSIQPTEESAEGPQPSVSVSIRRGLLRADLDASDGRGELDIAGLRLDDLELASLRGRVERGKISMDLRERRGEATLRVQQPRLSGVQGEVLDADASWDGRIVRLERAALDQRRSLYTLQGEHCLDDEVWESLPPPRSKPVEEPVTEVSESILEVVDQVVDGAEDAGWVVIDAADASLEEGLDAHPLSDVSDAESDVENDADGAEETLEAKVETGADEHVEASAAVATSEASDRTTPISQLKTSMKELFSFKRSKAKEASAPAQVTADAVEVTVEASQAAAVASGVTADAAGVIADDVLVIADTENEVESVEASGTSEVDDTEATDEESPTAEDVTAHEYANVDDVIPVADVETVDVDVPEAVVVAINQEDNVEAVTAAVEATAAATEERASSSNPLSGVMDRLAALKTKVMEGDSASDEAQMGTDVAASEASAAEGTVEQEPESVPLVEEMEPGSWRLLLAVPQADVEEMLPAVRLAAALREGATPLEYTRAKDHFLGAVRRIAIRASEELGRQLDEAAAAAAAEQRVVLKETTGATDGRAPADDAPVQLPGLQDLHGAWRGTVEVKGGNGATLPVTVGANNSLADQVSSVDFNVSGDGWSWGPYQVQSLEAQGNVDAVEGLQMRRFELRSDGAVVKIDGNLFGDVQNAAFAVIDLPAQRLAPMIHHITSAASASTGAPPPPPPPLPPIAGTLFVSGDIGGSVSSPTGSFRANLSEGRIGPVRLGHANAAAEVTEARTARFNAEANPAASNKRGAAQVTPGHLRLSGVIPLPDAEDRSVVVDWSVQDGGMQLISALSAPSLMQGGPVEWQEGGADITLAVRGTLADPVYDGAAVITRAKIVSPMLARPLYPVNANIRIQRNTLYADHFDAKCGPRGSIKVRGAVPVLHTRRNGGETWEGLVARADVQGGIRAEATGIDVRARAAYSGRLDADMVIKGTLLEPEVGGSLRLSKGTAFIQPNANQPAAGSAVPSGDAASRAGSGAVGFGNRETKRGLAGFLQRSTPPGSPSAKGDNGSEERPPLRFRGLRLIVGPELSAVYPFVLNFGVSGEVEINGVADPVLIRPSGVINFERGDINLVATQVRLSREHPNRAVFVPEHGMDPTLDVSLVGADLRALVQGKVSNWADNLVITRGSGAAVAAARAGGAGTGVGKVIGGVAPGDSSSIVGPSERDAAVAEAARIFEGQLAESLLEQDGQLAFSNLAASTVATLMPKIETGGQLGKARWRVTTAPSIPGLLSLDPSTDPFSNISQINLGSDWELMLGDSLQATMSRKLKESEMQTKFALVYKLTDKLRMQLNSESSTETRLLFEFTTNTNSSSGNNDSGRS